MSGHLSVTRPINSHGEAQLRQFIPELDSRIPDHLSLKWRKQGAMAISLVTRAEFMRAKNMRRGSLSDFDLPEVVAIVAEAMKQTATADSPVEVPTVAAHFLGAHHSNIALMLDSEPMHQERQRLIDVIDELNGIRGTWGEFKPHLSVAECSRDEPAVLELFNKLMPEIVTLQPVRTRAS